MRAEVVVLKLCGPEAVERGQRARYVCSSDLAIRPEWVVIEDDAHWVVNDITIKGQTQFMQQGDIPGELFRRHEDGPWARCVADGYVSFTSLHAGDVLAFDVTYVGPLAQAPFEASVQGTKS